MASASGTILLFTLSLFSAAGPQARWLGQTGQDRVSTSPNLEPNGFQDIQIRLENLPANPPVSRVEICPAGGGVWSTDGAPGTWRAVLDARPGANTADLFFESDREDRTPEVLLKVFFQGRGNAEVRIRGGRPNPNLRMPNARPRVEWSGADGRDITSAEMSVGPDGFEDARLTISNLAPNTAIRRAVLDLGEGPRWQSGVNPDGDRNAELIRDPNDPTRADLWFQPDRDLAGRSVRLTLDYVNEKHDRIVFNGTKTDPKRAVALPEIPKVQLGGVSARWLGQDRSLPSNAGDCRIALTGLPAGRTVQGVVVSDAVWGIWRYTIGEQVKLEGVPNGNPLIYRPGTDASSADLYLTPYRQGIEDSFTIRVLYENGDSALAQVKGSASDIQSALPKPDKAEIVAKPGDDLNALATRVGKLVLARGVHRCSKPLVLEKPIEVVGEPGAILEFAQADTEPPWTAAIKIHASSTTLREFMIRFAGPVRWNGEVSYGPAVIGTSDQFDGHRPDRKLGLLFQNLDIEGPPQSGSADWVEAIRLMRLVTAQGGTISGCSLRGGMIEFFGGPWRFLDNQYRGTPRGTYSATVVVGHYTHDVQVKGNRAKPQLGSGKTWRFLTLTGAGHGIDVVGNTVEGIGPMDNDKIPSHNAPEIILTESYKLSFEGRPLAVSADRRVITFHPLSGQQPQVGHLVSTITGPNVGNWRRITQPLSPSSFLLDEPLPDDSSLVCVSPGFVNLRVVENKIDCSGSRSACLVVLPGNNYGTIVRKNHLIGGGEAIRLMAAPSETPFAWGWTHAPYLGGLVEDNVIEDSAQGGFLGVEHSPHIKSNRGRTYMTVLLKNNLIRWSEPFLRAQARAKDRAPLRGLTFGYLPTHDPGEFIVYKEGGWIDAPPSRADLEGVYVNAAKVNGTRISRQAFRLPRLAPGDQVQRASQP